MPETRQERPPQQVQYNEAPALLVAAGGMANNLVGGVRMADRTESVSPDEAEAMFTAYRKGGATPKHPRHFEVNPETGCWEWLRARHSEGYGQLSRGRKQLGAHRVVYEAFVGPIPERARVLHKCDVPQCVNPAHLEIGSQAKNMRQMVERGRSLRGTKHPNSRFTDEQVAAIRKAHREGVTQLRIAQMVGCSAVLINRIVHGQTYQEDVA